MDRCARLSFCQLRYEKVDIKLPIFMSIFSKIFYYSVASTNVAAFVIWGSQQDGSLYLDVIAQFKDNAWSLYGNLQKPRNNQASITSGDLTTEKKKQHPAGTFNLRQN